MMKLTVIGYLGGNAERKRQNNEEYLQFRVSHTRRWKDELGCVHETTDWLTCFLRGRFDSLEPYLLKGQLVYVSGMPTARAYPSEKERKYVAGISISVDHIELLGKSIKNQQGQVQQSQSSETDTSDNDVVY